eukprot:660290-Heterocapsa_arctica.AAC.1
MRHPDDVERSRAQAAKQHGSGANPKSTGLGFRGIEQNNAGHVANGGGLQTPRTGQLSRIHSVQRHGQQAIQGGAGQVPGRNRTKRNDRGQDRRPSGVHHGPGIPVSDSQVRRHGGHHGARDLPGGHASDKRDNGSRGARGGRGQQHSGNRTMRGHQGAREQYRQAHVHAHQDDERSGGHSHHTRGYAAHDEQHEDMDQEQLSRHGQ